MAKVLENAKTRLLTYLNKDAGKTTLSVAQARSRFKIVNVAARISELRLNGVKIHTTMREGRDGVERAVYSLARRVRDVETAVRG